MKYSLRSLKFSVRDLMWLMLSIGVGLGWCVNTWQLNKEIRRLQERTSTLEAEILIPKVIQQTVPIGSSPPAPFLPSELHKPKP